MTVFLGALISVKFFFFCCHCCCLLFAGRNVGLNLYGSQCSIFWFFSEVAVFCPPFAYKITFNTIDNLIWKPQQTNNTKRERRGGCWKRIIEPCSGLVWSGLQSSLYLFHSSIYGNSFALLLFFEHFSAQDSFIFSTLFSFFRVCFPFHANGKMCSLKIPPVCLWSVKGRSNKCLLGPVVERDTCFYLSNKHLTTNIKDLNHKSVQDFLLRRPKHVADFSFLCFYFLIHFYGHNSILYFTICDTCVHYFAFLFLSFFLVSSNSAGSIIFFLIVCLMCRIQADFCRVGRKRLNSTWCLFITQHCHFVCHSCDILRFRLVYSSENVQERKFKFNLIKFQYMQFIMQGKAGGKKGISKDETTKSSETSWYSVVCKLLSFNEWMNEQE